MPESAEEELRGGLAQAQPHSGRSCLPGWWVLSLPPGLDSVTSVTSPSKGPAQVLAVSLCGLPDSSSHCLYPLNSYSRPSSSAQLDALLH